MKVTSIEISIFWKIYNTALQYFMFFAVLKNLKSSFSEDNMPEHAPDILIENATKMVWVIPLNAKNGEQILR